MDCQKTTQKHRRLLEIVRDATVIKRPCQQILIRRIPKPCLHRKSPVLRRKALALHNLHHTYCQKFAAVRQTPTLLTPPIPSSPTGCRYPGRCWWCHLLPMIITLTEAIFSHFLANHRRPDRHVSAHRDRLRPSYWTQSTAAPVSLPLAVTISFSSHGVAPACPVQFGYFLLNWLRPLWPNLA